tara:strand:- start:7174 stop:7308 length:135 start_codon:yes stop_codon:yes gene_type:complete
MYANEIAVIVLATNIMKLNIGLSTSAKCIVYPDIVPNRLEPGLL